jgi:putative ABC transport system permease protein
MLFASLLIAACGLSTVLIINASAKQSYTTNSTFLISNVKYQVIPKTSQATLNKSDYANLRKLGFDQLIALAQSSTHIYAEQKRVFDRRIDITGIDTIALLSLISNRTYDKATVTNQTNKTDQSGILATNPFSSPVGIVHPSLLTQLSNGAPNFDNDSEYFSIIVADTNTQDNSDDNLNKNNRANNNVDNNTFKRRDNNKTSGIKTRSLPKLVTFEDPSLGNDLVMDIGEFYRLFPNNHLSSLLLVSAMEGPALEELVDALRLALPAHLKLVSLNQGMQQGELTNSFHMNLLAMALLMFVVCLFIVINAVNLLLNARMPWFKICRQLGLSRNVIFIGQIIEMVSITFVASCVGIYLSIHLSNLVAPTVQATLEGLYGVEVGFGNTSLLSLFLQVFGISVCGSIAATVAPFNASNQALHSTHSYDNLAANQKKWRRNFWLLSILFLLVSLAILSMATALWLLLVATATLILSGCSLLLANYPRAIDAVYRLIPPAFVMLRISTKQSSALSGKTKVACCAFFIAATSNIGMNLMVDSFRGATISWLESRLATDYYLYYEGNIDITSIARDKKIEVFQRFENNLNYNGSPLQQHSYPTTQQFKDALVFYKIEDSDTAWKTFSDSNGVFVNQQFAFEYNLGINDTISVPHPSTQQLTNYVIQGIIYDFGNPYRQILLPLSQFNSAISKSTIYTFNADEKNLRQFKIALNKQGIDTEKSLLNTQQLLAISTQAFDRTFIITDGLNIVTLLVAALSLACAVVVLMDTARPQNMLLRSFGVSAIKTQLLALFQYFILCLIALLFATPFGILLSWGLIYEINLQAFQWTYPLQINALKILQVYAVSLSIVLLIIAIPIIKASKRPLIEDIRWLN